MEDLFYEQMSAELRYQEMIYQFNKRIYNEYIERNVDSSEE
ncbi:MAG: hypothetical protein ACO393_05990 [Methylophilaceae bacterium]